MEVLPMENLVFLDESGCNVAMTRTHGWAPEGERAHSSRPFNHGDNITLIGAIRASGPVVLRRMRGSMNKERFINFVRHDLAPRLAKDDVVVLDNLGSHYADEAIQAIEARCAHVLFLPRYSPDMNPIEMVWSWVKRQLRRVAARTFDSLLGAINTAWRRVKRLSLTAFIRACGYGQCN